MRPIIFLINSPTHFLAKIINDELKKVIPPPKSYIKNSFELIKKIQNIHIPDDHVLMSLNVCSLYTNIPCNLVINSLDSRMTLINKNCFIPHIDIVYCTQFLFENTYFAFSIHMYIYCHKASIGHDVIFKLIN